MPELLTPPGRPVIIRSAASARSHERRQRRCGCGPARVADPGQAGDQRHLREEGEHVMASYVRYIDRTREYYKTKGYDKPYKWAQFEDVPFAPLNKPLAECRVVLISTSEIAMRGVEREGEADAESIVGGVYSIGSQVSVEQLYSNAHGYDRVATTLEDVNAFYPTSRLHEAVKAGRIGGLTERFHGVYNAYSQRHTREKDVVEVLRRCREDGADVAVLTPV
jgi:D-proline reductase (dithiol) PrdB